MKMKTIFLLLIITTITSAQINSSLNNNAKFSSSIQAGLFNGAGININFLTSNFAENFPFSTKLSFGISFLDAGNPLDARKIFINNNTNGIPEQSGTTFAFGLDFLYKTSFFGLKRNYLYAGPRYTMFTGNFNFIGGNEDFDVTSNQWGIGVGLENYFRIVPALDLVINFGFDYYMAQSLYGHDTSYSPDGLNVNPREDFTFSDADKAVNQPKYQAKAMIGFSYNIN